MNPFQFEDLSGTFSAFDVAEDGSLGPRRDFAVFDELPPAGTDLQTLLSHTKVGPDGAAGDSEGGVWFADAFGQRAARVLDGKIVDTVDVGTGVYACALGGVQARPVLRDDVAVRGELEEQPALGGIHVQGGADPHGDEDRARPHLADQRHHRPGRAPQRQHHGQPDLAGELAHVPRRDVEHAPDESTIRKKITPVWRELSR